MVEFTRRQWLTLIVISIADFCNAICVSLQAPFYPQEVSFYQKKNIYYRYCKLLTSIMHLLLQHKYYRKLSFQRTIITVLFSFKCCT
jgi:hypothetical protein